MDFKKDKTQSLFQLALLLQGIASFLALFIYAYVGTFTRLLADDYYHLFLLQSEKNLFEISLEKYLNISNRYSTMTIFAFEKWLGIKWIAALMIFLWVLGLIWLFVEIQKITGAKLSRFIIPSVAILLIFLSILQAPNRFQTIYWISASLTYFFPLVFFTVFLASIFAFLRRRFTTKTQRNTKKNSVVSVVISIITTFFIGGLSETAGALHIVMLILIMLAFRIWVEKKERNSAFVLLGAALLGALLSLAVMSLSPANAIRSSAEPLPISVFINRLIIFPYGFITDSFKTLPLPSLITLILGFLSFHGQKIRVGTGLAPVPSGDRKKGDRKGTPLQWALLITPILVYILISASFAPSAYALSYPDERVRFPARVVMTFGLFIEGALLGSFFFGRKKLIFALMLIGGTLYPLRGAYQAYQELPKYQAYANAWDEREAYILSQKEKGIMDISLPPMDGLAGIKEFDVDPKHWVNSGAANYYGVDAISVHSLDLGYD